MTMNKAQQRALFNKYAQQRKWPFQTYIQFRRTAEYYHHMNCWMVPWCGMFVGIEEDGYTHT